MVPLTAIREFLRLEAAAGPVLIASAAAALLVANSPLAGLYDRLLEWPLAVQLGPLALAKPLLLWINDGLMAALFLLIGLEVRRQFLEGELSPRAEILLPLAGASGGLVVPVLVYVVATIGDPAAQQGWAIPAMADMSLAIAVLSLVGPRVPASLKILLLTLAAIGNLGAITLVAVSSAGQLPLVPLGLALIGIAAMITLNRLGVMAPAGYVLIGVAVWLCMLGSGIHAALVWVAVALCIPIGGGRAHDRSPLKELAQALHPWVAFGILPLFAFANAGLPLAELSIPRIMEPVPLAIIAGLVLGKPLGVLGFAAAAVRLGWCRLPSGLNWRHLCGVALLAGIGFTMSLFVGTLAFGGAAPVMEMRIGVVFGSLLSAGLGFLVLRFLCSAD